jgi:hypothetical protein
MISPVCTDDFGNSVFKVGNATAACYNWCAQEWAPLTETWLAPYTLWAISLEEALYLGAGATYKFLKHDTDRTQAELTAFLNEVQSKDSK